MYVIGIHAAMHVTVMHIIVMHVFVMHFFVLHVSALHVSALPYVLSVLKLVYIFAVQNIF